MFPFSNKYLVDSGTYLKNNEQETSTLVDFEHSNLYSFDKKAFLANIQFLSVPVLAASRRLAFLGVSWRYRKYCWFAFVIVQCLLNKTLVFHFPTDEAL